VLSSFNSQSKATLHELCRVMGLPGKPDGISGADVERYYREGRIREIAEHCESDVVNTYRVWLRHELFRGRLSAVDFEACHFNGSSFDVPVLRYRALVHGVADSIICIGALVAHREDGRWTVTALGAPHVGERPEKALISSFVDRIAELSPQGNLSPMAARTSSSLLRWRRRSL
jgi:hypothetical protein